ncbi:GNAT family N-acetyltransferase [Roseburia sp. BX0805]|uniref:GNAT family N-acetyltransferase n=1 Tax=Roseburia yibonii TaxID=2763063 RepID=A0ABR7I935_9FIRM|nr:GNAT family N-acetyltransferase [Roseburia yibonii]MBC5753446.1 GNAT family N-acetyltransferase [Roseburia yibonii]MEE0117193.1 GNAT family N-acetyltransferase [Lachnospiraceae bacterium]
MNGIKVTNLSENEIEQICREIGDSFYDHAYGRKKDGTTEYGLRKLLDSREKMYQHMKACFLAGYESGCLYSTSRRGEGYILVTCKGQDLSFKSGVRMIRAIVKNLGGLRGGIQFVRRIATGGKTYEDELKKKKIPYANLAMLVVRKEYQGQGYMRQLMEMLYQIADEKNLAVILETDAENKVERYEHLGMKLVKTRDLGEGVFLYDLYRASSFL